jgi:hypothetical protein
MAAFNRTMLRFASSMALSHALHDLVKFILTLLSRLIKLLGMAESFDYGKAYKQVSNDLKSLLAERERLDRKISKARQTLEALATSCEEEGIEVEPSAEAQYLLESATLPDEILGILDRAYPNYHRATIIRDKLEQLGHDMSQYRNPLATIHMILKRQIEAGKVETGTNKQKEKLFRASHKRIMGRRFITPTQSDNCKG